MLFRSASRCTVLALANVLCANAVPIVPEQRAWAALLTGNVENMTTMALLQISSVKRFSAYQTHLTMVTPEVNEVARRQLRAAGDHAAHGGPQARVCTLLA